MDKILSEAEIKVELSTLDEVGRVKRLLNESGFAFTGRNILQEYYITKVASPHGGWDFERLRKVGDAAFLRTIKTWTKDKNGNSIRLEDETAIDEDTFTKTIDKGFVLHFTKVREDFKGSIGGNPSTVSIDILTQDDKARYFLECEVIVDQEKSHESREMLKRWMTHNLSVDCSNEAPSMIDIVSSFSA